jgi:hypothetical protein
MSALKQETLGTTPSRAIWAKWRSASATRPAVPSAAMSALKQWALGVSPLRAISAK